MLTSVQLPHLHLTSTYQFPLVQRITTDQVLQNLLQAPQVVREMKPMAWTYLTPPQDGTMFLTWQAPRLGNNFASDGYIWIDAESTFRQNIRGYVSANLLQSSGIRLIIHSRLSKFLYIDQVICLTVSMSQCISACDITSSTRSRRYQASIQPSGLSTTARLIQKTDIQLAGSPYHSINRS